MLVGSLLEFATRDFTYTMLAAPVCNDLTAKNKRICNFFTEI